MQSFQVAAWAEFVCWSCSGAVLLWGRRSHVSALPRGVRLGAWSAERCEEQGNVGREGNGLRGRFPVTHQHPVIPQHAGAGL